MTLDETRQLGIEFERRIQTMIPETKFFNKLDTDTIYSFLNQYQDKYIREVYKNLDNVKSGSKVSSNLESILQSILTTYNIKVEEEQNESTNTQNNNNISIVDTARSYTFVLPSNFYMYLRSVSDVSSTFTFVNNSNENNQSTKILPNQLVSQSDIQKLIETPHNSLRILKYPVVALNQYKNRQPTITLVYDRYTTINGIRVIYYRKPANFNLITSTPCELPMDVFDDLVTGAVNLYVDYVAGAEAKKRQQQEEAKRQARENQKDAGRSGENQDE